MFKIGDTFSYHCPFTGGHSTCVITEIKETEVVAKVINEEIDGTFEIEDTYPLCSDENGQYIELWKYRDHVAKYYAK